MYTFIVDIGKTHLKSVVLDEEGQSVWSSSRSNLSLSGPPYLHINIDAIDDWLLAALRDAATLYPIDAINISTHGACAVLLDRHGQRLFPVMDYEADAIEALAAGYDAIRPDFRHTQSPRLPQGLNLGRQLYALRQYDPVAFARLHTLLLYPQYWAWRLTGIAVTERTSLGCHTDLWQPRENHYSELVDHLGVHNALPPIVDAHDCVGTLHPDWCQLTGLPRHCCVYAGVHDSNASFARYIAADASRPLTVVSTGTWVIALSSEASCERLDEHRDMLANVSVTGHPLACTRFMGGREFELICKHSGADVSDTLQTSDIQEVIDAGAFALPSLTAGCGPFPGLQGRITGRAPHGKALATLYLALMIDTELSLLGVQGDVILGSSSRKNPLLCQLLAGLRPGQPILMSGDEASTIRGAWCLTRWHGHMPEGLARFERAEPPELRGLQGYRERWLEQLANY